MTETVVLLVRANEHDRYWECQQCYCLFPEQRESTDTQCPHCGAEITEWVEPPGR